MKPINETFRKGETLYVWSQNQLRSFTPTGLCRWKSALYHKLKTRRRNMNHSGTTFRIMWSIIKMNRSGCRQANKWRRRWCTWKRCSWFYMSESQSEEATADKHVKHFGSEPWRESAWTDFCHRFSTGTLLLQNIIKTSGTEVQMFFVAVAAASWG